MLLVMKKLKRLKGVLKEWNKLAFRSVEVALQQAHEEYDTTLNFFDEDIDSLEALEELNIKEVVLNTTMINRDMFVKQKFMNAWIHEGERNSKLMHSLYKGRIK